MEESRAILRVLFFFAQNLVVRVDNISFNKDVDHVHSRSRKGERMAAKKLFEASDI